MDRYVWYISLNVTPASNTGTKTCFKKVGVTFQGLMHMLSTVAILKYYKGSTPWACSSNRSMGVALCKPFNFNFCACIQIWKRVWFSRSNRPIQIIFKLGLTQMTRPNFNAGTN